MRFVKGLANYIENMTLTYVVFLYFISACDFSIDDTCPLKLKLAGPTVLVFQMHFVFVYKAHIFHVD